METFISNPCRFGREFERTRIRFFHSDRGVRSNIFQKAISKLASTSILGRKGVGRKLKSSIMAIIFLSSVLASAIPHSNCLGATLIVPDNYPTIQAAINAASTGDTVFVRSGTYFEHLGVEKTISVVGQNAQTTVIDGEDNPAVSVVSGSNILIQGFTLKASLADRQGLSLIEMAFCNNVTIQNSIIRGIAGAYHGQPGYAVHGIGLNTCNNIAIANNWIGDFAYGLLLMDSAENTIRNNVINNTWVGIGISGLLAVNNIIQNNTITYTGAIHWGEYSAPQIPFSGIEVTNNASGNLFEHNRITNCYCGVTLESAMNNTFVDNLIVSNGYIHYLLANPDAPQVDIFGDNDIWIATHKKWNWRDWWSTLPSTGNVFYRNCLERMEKIHVACANNSWDGGYSFGGNYWKRYLAEDLLSGPDQNAVGADGIWDYALVIDENNIDNYPLVNSAWSGFGVHNIDTGKNYLTVQQAIDAEETIDGHMIRINASSRFEHITVSKRLSIIGNGSGTTMMDGHGTGRVISITTSYVQIQNLTVQNGEIGILFDSSNNSTAVDLDVLGNVECIRLVNCSNNTIRNNLFSGNFYGMKFLNSINNKVVHNSFVKNTCQVQIASTEQPNIWDTGYPSGGNYWSDYDGTDADHDGIGDTPYIIDNSNQDNYPSMKMPGTDVNHDGKVNVLDLILVANHLGWSGLPGSTPEDVNRDGRVNVLDLISIGKSLTA